MARYIDADRLIKTIFPLDCVDKKHYSINAQAVYNAIKEAPTADVATKSEVDELKGELAIAERHEKDARALFKDAVIQLQNARAEVAREIFAEIDRMIYKVLNDRHYIVGDMCYEVSELKKKYIGEADDPANQS